MRRGWGLVLLWWTACGGADELVVPERSLLLAYQASLVQQSSRPYPFSMRSDEQGDTLFADVLMDIPVSYTEFRQRLSAPRRWCDFLILHLNIKSCVAQERQGQETLVLYAGRKHYQPPEITYKLEYRFQLQDNREQFFEVLMDAPRGPLSTADYRIHLRAIPYAGKTVVALGLNYKQSFISRAATYSYLNTLGRDKVGFSLLNETSAEDPNYVGGVKGVIERNVMRYFLALQIYLQSDIRADSESFKQRLIAWYRASEQYHRQLYEYEQDIYLQAKQQEYLNQQQLQLEIDRKAAGSQRPAG